MSKIKDCKVLKALSNAKDKFISCKFCRAVDKACVSGNFDKPCNRVP